MRNNIDGFLDKENQEFTSHICRDRADLFSLWMRLNQYSQMTIHELNNCKVNALKEVLVTNHYIRISNLYQSCIILESKGLEGEAKILLRTMLEVLSHLTLVINDPEFISYYLLKSKSEKLRKIDRLIDIKDKYSNINSKEKELVAQKEKLKIELAGFKEITIAKLIEKAGYKSYRNSLYPLCSDFTHSSLEALEVYIEQDTTTINYGPIAKDINSLFTGSMDFLFIATDLIRSFFEIEKDSHIYEKIKADYREFCKSFE